MEAPPPATSKLRLMCSYGGQILPHPNSKSLCYIGGDNRIVSVNRTTITSLSSLIFHLSAALSVSANFSIKYQLPNRNLDSLVFVADDRELQIMLDLQDRLLASNNPSRIRLFLFPSELGFGEPKVERSEYVFNHPKTEAWFIDALKSARIMGKGRNCLDGFEDDDGSDAQSDVDSVPESVVLEMSSSFGSTSSSIYLSQLRLQITLRMLDLICRMVQLICLHRSQFSEIIVFLTCKLECIKGLKMIRLLDTSYQDSGIVICKTINSPFMVLIIYLSTQLAIWQSHLITQRINHSCSILSSPIIKQFSLINHTWYT